MLATSSRVEAADRPQAKLRDGGKQVAGLFNRGAAAGEGRCRSPQLAADEGMAREDFGVVAKQKNQNALACGREPKVEWKYPIGDHEVRGHESKGAEEPLPQALGRGRASLL